MLDPEPRKVTKSTPELISETPGFNALQKLVARELEYILDRLTPTHLKTSRVRYRKTLVLSRVV